METKSGKLSKIIFFLLTFLVLPCYGNSNDSQWGTEIKIEENFLNYEYFNNVLALGISKQNHLYDDNYSLFSSYLSYSTNNIFKFNIKCGYILYDKFKFNLGFYYNNISNIKNQLLQSNIDLFNLGAQILYHEKLTDKLSFLLGGEILGSLGTFYSKYPSFQSNSLLYIGTLGLSYNLSQNTSFALQYRLSHEENRGIDNNINTSLSITI
jgi:hypothetical protein